MRPTLDASYATRSQHRLAAERTALLASLAGLALLAVCLYAVAEVLASALWLWRLNRELACAY
ncbi:hypothetical protein [Methylococcus mesophilus]|uniref:hypothetical protein n=1 Tax=Methylococcus mesophilus TaxID=2993564 RepID=UPI00224ABD54|nr:hypothetical protein [Methylococcus mesophilus]UZR30207.1 hypothetical protein OOT43_06075 [Methylococcus mesophilus]